MPIAPREAGRASVAQDLQPKVPACISRDPGYLKKIPWPLSSAARVWKAATVLGISNIRARLSATVRYMISILIMVLKNRW